ncbi:MULTISPECIES: glycerol-3-phosphate acyltransferase [Psychrobacillus]|uniref:Glycerol-3-phosphate acyltransferase n=1 Tax=Psychrobacillus faecigallinarum TaxID=2762235 RepID=A0ABR8RAU5_9BACI|nr:MULTISPECIES: glycerol-3-phosphate acyltransferase [Psychrobacillus]MBD7944772.1 glycerol-3-phosphate acyltransferase [Psychrobacillus faecigallinarum]QEY21229.1 glycerol-3-phosphate acyltransferase [Psychrobacillus sp. AK 1817]
MIIWSVSILLIGYLVGSIHGSKLAQWMSGVNIKKEGLNNSGASNATIVLGWKYGVLVGAIDILKGAIMIIGARLIAPQLTSLSTSEHDFLLYIAGAAVILGHNFPIYTKFKGGKGTASIIGVLLALHWPIGLAGLLLLICITLLTDYLLIGVFFFYLIFIGASIWTADGIGPIIVAGFLFLMASFLHIENVQRLIRKEEVKISSVMKKKKPSL